MRKRKRRRRLRLRLSPPQKSEVIEKL